MRSFKTQYHKVTDRQTDRNVISISCVILMRFCDETKLTEYEHTK